MGERLNLEIKENGKVLANAYYHWSGYTSSSLELTKIILDNIPNINYEDRVVYAVKLLEITGSGLTDEEIIYGKKHISNFEEYQFEKTSGRNNGLTSISEKGIEDTQTWEEHRVEIHLDTKTINFGALWEIPKEEYIEDYEEYDEVKYDNIPVYDIKFVNLPFNEFEEFSRKILNAIKNKVYKFRLEGDETVLGFIE